ncbi:MAG: hypothetical protein ACRENK_16015 [Gemmatimonadaceae bacterium]
MRYTEAAGRFLDALKETPDVWRSIDVRVVALFIGGEWHSLLTRCQIDSRAPDEVVRLERLPSNEVLQCLQDVRDASVLPRLLEDVSKGRLSVRGTLIALREFTDSVNLGGDSYQNWHAQLGSRETAASTVRRPQSFKAHTLTASSTKGGNHLTSLVAGGEDSVNQFLRGLEHPWDGIDGLGRVALESPTPLRQLYQPMVQFVAPLGVAIDPEKTMLQSGLLTVTVSANSLSAGRSCSVGYMAEFADGGYRNGTIDLSNRRWKGHRLRTAAAQKKLGDARRVTLLLRLGSHQVDSLELQPRDVSRANVHALSYVTIDPNLRALREIVERTEAQALSTKNGSREFENAVARLFSLLGFRSDAIDTFSGLTDAVDVLASTPDGSVVLAVEATLGALNTEKGKPSKLINRVDQLRKALVGLSVEVLPVMATSRTRSALLKGDVNHLAQDGVSVLAREDLLELLDGIERGWDAVTALSFCSDHVGYADEHYENQGMKIAAAVIRGGRVVRRRSRA